MIDPNPYQSPHSANSDQEEEPKRYKSPYRDRDANLKYVGWIILALMAYSFLFRYLTGR